MWWAITRQRINSRVQGYKQGPRLQTLKILLTFLYKNYINQYTARDTVGKGYGNLAANIGPTSEKPSPIQFLINLLTAQRNLYLDS